MNFFLSRCGRTARGLAALTKPTILLLVLVTGVAALVVQGDLTLQPGRFALALALLAAAGGSANAFNQYFEREVDGRMERTRRRRPIPAGTIPPWAGLATATALAAISTVGFYLWFNLLAAVLSLATILFYSFFYTLYLKPRTPLNIVIGGAAGAMAPVIGWAAAAGEVSVSALLMAAVIFLWTPPHFWALALCLKDDYRRVNYPMMPLTAGDEETLRQISAYSIATLLVSLALAGWTAGVGFAAAAAGLGLILVRKAARVRRRFSPSGAWKLFGYSIVYLLALFTALIVDHGLGWKPFNLI